MAVQDAGGAQEHGAGADGRQRFHLGGPQSQPLNHGRVVEFLTRTPTARDHENIQLGATGKGLVGDDFHAPRRNHGGDLFCYQKHFKGRGFLPPPVLVEAGSGENFKRPAKIENFDFFKYYDADTFSFHRFPYSYENAFKQVI